MGKGAKAPPQQTDQNIVQSNLPKYFEPYAVDMMKRAESESQREYTPYEGQRLADENSDTLASREMARNVAGFWYSWNGHCSRRHCCCNE
jgi:hypothetical protein